MNLGESASAYGPALTGAEYGEVFIEETLWSSARLEDGAVRDVGAGRERGLGLRLLKREDGRVRTYFGSAQDVAAAAAGRLRERILPGAPGRA